MYNESFLFLFLGPSGVGKSTLIKKIIEQYAQIFYYPSYTTRSPREGEIDGKDYFFITEKEFEKKAKEKFFIEIDKPHDKYYYGIAEEPLARELLNGNSFIKDVAINGLDVFLKTRLKKYIVSFFLMPFDKEDLFVRLQQRNALNDQDRIFSVDREMTYYRKCDHEILIKHNDIDFGYKQTVILLDKYLSKTANFEKE